MKKRLFCLLILAALLTGALGCGIPAGAENAAETRITPLEWSWMPGNAATFEGTAVLPENAPETVTMKLAVAPQPAEKEIGEIVFTYINDRRLTVRKQAAEYTLNTAEQSGAVSFRGSWILPEDQYFSSAELTLSLAAEDGTVLSTRTFAFSEDDEATQSGGRSIIRLPFNLNRVILYLAIAAGALWCAAILRMILARRNKMMKKGA
ncbi:MAG: hypothetical protein J6U01_00880 [Clostridia bacterium]|nr:hypothetical protein [Clostridia bacterium]